MAVVSAWYILFVALGLSMDTLAIAVAVGTGYKPITARTVFRISFHFSLFQVGLFALGCEAGSFLERYFGQYDHWVAAALLWLIGGHMVLEWWKGEATDYQSDPSRGLSLIFLSFATSIDALAAGASLGLLGASVGLSSLILAATTATLAIVGMEFGRKLGNVLGRWGMLAGGIALIVLGGKIVFEHVIV